MSLRLPFGNDSVATLDVPAEALLALCEAPRGEPLVQVAAAVDRALAEPLAFPALAQSVVPGDKVVLALAMGVPHAATIVERTVAALLSAGIVAEDITLIRTQQSVEMTSGVALAAVPGSLIDQIQQEIHDPKRRDSLSYLAADTSGKAIYINRTLHEADAVISIGCLRLDDSPGYYGANSSVFPAFSDAAQIERFHTAAVAQGARRQKLHKQADEVGWLLGLQFTIQIVPGAGDEILHLLAGALDAVFREGSRLCEQAWSFRVPRRADLVIATLVGGAGEQTWENVGRALAAAGQAQKTGGAVIVCTELAEEVGPALQHVAGAVDLEEALEEIQRHTTVDALSAAEIVQAMQRGKVFLISRLDENLVEELGIGPITADQLSRVARRYDSCIVLTNAQFAAARPADEEAPAPSAGKRKSRT